MCFSPCTLRFSSHRRWWPWLLLPVLAVVPSFYSTRDVMAALARFLAISITLMGALAFGRRWWPRYALLAAGAALVLLLASDSHAVFGLLFDLVLVAGAVAAGSTRRLVPGGWPGVVQQAMGV